MLQQADASDVALDDALRRRRRPRTHTYNTRSNPQAGRECLDGQRLYHRYFEDGQFARLHTLADGSCFFYSLASAINYQNFAAASRLEQTRIGRELRSKIFTPERYADFLETIPECLRDMVDEDSGARLIPTLEQAQSYSFHATDPLWRLAAQALGVVICVVETPRTFYVTNNDSGATAVVLMGWLDRCHFEPLVALPSAATGTPCSDESLAVARAVLGQDAHVGARQGDRVGVFDISAPVVQRFLGR